MRNLINLILLVLIVSAVTGCARVRHLKQSDPDTGERILEETVMTSFWAVDENTFSLLNSDGVETVEWSRATDGTTGPDSAINALANIGAFALTGQLRNFTPQAAPAFDARSGFATEQPNEVTAKLMTDMAEAERLRQENAELKAQLEAAAAAHGGE